MTASRFHILILACVLITVTGCSVAPNPLRKDDIEMIAENDRQLIFQEQEEIEGELTLELAMALALKYNLENRVRLLEEAVANQQLDMSKVEMMPSLAASAGYLERDNVNASRSVSVNTGEESLEPSTSQATETASGRATFSWNLLDFGVSYLQAKQDADRYLIAQKAREKVMLSLMKEVRGAYWQAVAMEQMRGDLDRISGRVDELLAYWEAIREERLRPPIAVLMDIRALIETRRQLDEIRRSIDTASARLANLINARDFKTLNFPEAQSFPELEDVTSDIEALELVALSNSADYASEIYRVRIDQLESRKAMARLLPGLEFSYGENYDDNDFLLNNRWGEFGVNLTGDLTQLMFTKRIRKFRQTNEELTISRKLAINMAVITGVHISWQDYQNALVQLQRADYLKEIDEQISLLTANAEANRAETGAAAIQNELRAFRSKISQLQSYADAQQAYGSFVVSLGVNPVPPDYQRMSAKELSTVVAQRFKERFFPYTAEGQALLAERQQLDKWVERAAATESKRAAEALAALEAEESVSDELPSVPEALEEETAPQEQLADLAEEPPVEADTLVDQEIAIEEEPLQVAEALPAVEEVIAAIESAPKVPDEPVRLTTATPSLSEFIAHFWLKYFPQPSARAFLDEFLANPPEPPSRQGYIQHFIDNLPDGPDREAYLQLFLNNLPDGPSREAYLNLFLENLADGPDREAYLKLFLNNLPDGPDRNAYLELFLNKLKQGPKVMQYIRDFEATSKEP